jgi:hypothetical protein
MDNRITKAGAAAGGCNNIIVTTSSQTIAKPLVMRSLPSDDELSKIFESYSDCYADTGRFENDGSYSEGEVIQAMTKERFIEAVKLLGNDA